MNLTTEQRAGIYRLVNRWKHDRTQHRNWWIEQAILSVELGYYTPIFGRNDADLYLLRMWMVRPALDEKGDFESENSVMLYYFPRGDDDASLHDHPWSFSTTILSGGYAEHLPPLDWEPESTLGPAWDVYVIQRAAGETISHHATDLHCVGRVMTSPSTFTLVRTGFRERDWGFHRPGEIWTPYKPKAIAAAARASS